MQTSAVTPPSASIVEDHLREAIDNYCGMTPAEAEALARARVAAAISKISNAGDMTARTIELRFLEVKLAYEILRRQTKSDFRPAR